MIECGVRNCVFFFKFYVIFIYYIDYFVNDSGIKVLWKCRFIYFFIIFIKDVGVYGRINLFIFGNIGFR